MQSPIFYMATSQRSEKQSIDINAAPSIVIAKIRKSLRHLETDWQPTSFLSTGSEMMDACLGTPGKGIPFGKMVELFGPESSGKSATALDLIAAAQVQGASTIWLDAENSWENRWARIRGVKCKPLFLIQPYLGRFGKDSELRMAAAEELCSEAEKIMRLLAAKRQGSTLMVVDSVTALLSRGESDAGIENQNMRTKLSLPQFLGQLLRRWVGVCQATNTTIVFINQLRINPNAMFGNPEYQPGGKALKFYCHVRASVRRGNKGGLLTTAAGKKLGIRGVITCVKTKVGGEEGTKVGYKIYDDGRTVYVPAKDVKVTSAGTKE